MAFAPRITVLFEMVANLNCEACLVDRMQSGKMSPQIFPYPEPSSLFMCACFSFRFWKDHHLRASKDFIIVTILTLRRKPFDHKFSTIFFMQSMFSADKKQHSTKKRRHLFKAFQSIIHQWMEFTR